MRSLLLNSTLLAVLCLLVFSIVRIWQSRSMELGWVLIELKRIFLNRRIFLLLLLGSSINLSLRLAAGYINPRDFLQDSVAAQELLNGNSLYPDNLHYLANEQTRASFPGESILRTTPILKGEFDNIGSNVLQNAHPPFVGVILAVPIAILGTRGSFLLVWFLSSVTLITSFYFIIREIFGRVHNSLILSVLVLIFGWYPVLSTLRSGQFGIFLLGLFVLSWALLRRERMWLAGIPIGIAASIQAFPGFIILYFFFRSTRSFLSAIGTLVAINGSIAMAMGLNPYIEWLDVVSKLSDTNLQDRLNYSFMGVSSFLLSILQVDISARIVSMSITVAIAIITCAICLVWRRTALDWRRIDIEFCCILFFMLVASPICWDRYFPILLLPIAVIVSRLDVRNSSRAIPLLLFPLAMISVPSLSLHWLFVVLRNAVGAVPAWFLTSLPAFSLFALGIVCFWNSIALIVPSRHADTVDLVESSEEVEVEVV